MIQNLQNTNIQSKYTENKQDKKSFYEEIFTFI
jgi:hypothetical protein